MSKRRRAVPSKFRPTLDLDSIYVKLLHRRTTLRQYLADRVDDADWRGVMDAACELREVDAVMALIE